MYEFATGELAAGDRASVEEHVASCPECSAALAGIQSVVRLLPRPLHLPHEERPQEFWNALTDAIEARTARPPRRSNPFNDAIEWIHGHVTLRPRVSYGIAAVCTATLVFLGTWTFMPRDEARPTTTGNDLEVTQPPHPEFTSTDVPVGRLNQYFRRSKTLLVGLANMKTHDAPFDLSMERRVSRDLLLEARELQMQPLDGRSRRLMNDLEKILIELANIEENHDLPDVEIIRGGIRQENLLFKIRMAEARYDPARFVNIQENRQGVQQ
jgi:hypothetical protein